MGELTFAPYHSARRAQRRDMSKQQGEAGGEGSGNKGGIIEDVCG